MNREESLLALYRKWMECATFENRIIQERKWDELNTYSQAKQELMKAIEEIDPGAAASRTPRSNELRLLVHQLADLEQLNGTLIQERMTEARVQLGDFQRSARKVQQIRRRYDLPAQRAGSRFSGKA